MKTRRWALAAMNTMERAGLLLWLLLLPAASSRDDRIIGGTECPELGHPWLVLLYYFDQHYCSGILLNQEWVVTAAHCQMSHIQVRLGEHSRGTYSGHEQFAAAQDIIPHPCFQMPTDGSQNYEHDIMLFRLSPLAVYSSYVQPLALTDVCPSDGTLCTVMGWGTTTSPQETYPDTPQCVDVEIVSNAACQAIYPGKVTEKMLCAGVPQGGKDSCQGDSGGPLVCDGKLQGLVSWGDSPCGQANKPGVYTSICKYLGWINKTMAGEGHQLPFGPRSQPPLARVSPHPMELMAIVLLLVAAGVAVSAQEEGDRIIGGYMCPRYSQPWQAFIYGPLQCGGILVNASWVLSAAHCYRVNLRVRLGEHDLLVHEGLEQERVVVHAILHPSYNHATLDNDLMLLKLDRPVTIGQTARPITLPRYCAAMGTTCLISGWGTITSPQAMFPRYLQCGDVEIISSQSCRYSYPGRVTRNMLCAGVTGGGIDSCQGDSGGPLTCKGQLQGIVSWGLQTCAQPNRPGVYTKVCKYVGWIRSTMQNN
ncbi:transmembrane protease serine 9-like [Carettochelys insculpta]|uniref:transmembrane protease serine 9-like n=1 Tax=Carettochelys insculpta TaxID=44489 RepID=UPI003EB9A104